MEITCKTIGWVNSPFKEKFGIPRQPGLVPQARGSIELIAPYNQAESVIGLAEYSHIWVQFLFHRTVRDSWRPTVRPPRLGGNRRVGVFASRSPFRPNALGLSVVKLEQVAAESGRLALEISGLDLLDGTPVIDIKPYLPYVDSVPGAHGGYAPTAPEKRLRVRISNKADSQIRLRSEIPELRNFILALLETDPRPAYVEAGRTERVYGIQIYDFDLRWRVSDGEVEVVELVAR